MSPPSTGSPLETWRKAWSAWARSAGLEVAWAKQAENPPERRRPYVRLEVLSLKTVGVDGQTHVFDETTQKMNRVLEGLREVVLSVQVVANAAPELEGSAWAWADELLGTLETDENAAAFKEAGLSVSSVGTVVDLGAFEQSEYVGRTTFDVTFLGAYYRVNPTAGGWIGEITGSGDVEGNSDPELTFDVVGP